MIRRRTLATLITASACFLAPAAAQARDGSITSFDGTKIVYSFFPAPGLKTGQRASTVMVGPGYGSGRSSSSDAEVSALRSAGYNVLTWDPRGFGQSGGNVEIDSPDYEGRDASKLIDLLARQPEVRLDAPGDPHLGMAGMSYGGGIQWITAAADRRVDVIAPMISWHSLVTSLDKSNTAKGGWGSILFGLGVEGTTVPGAAAFQFGRQQDPAANRALLDGLTTGGFTPEDRAFFAARGPDFLLDRIHVPTLILQATSDTLFTLKEAIDNYAAVRDNGVPLKMTWFCGSLQDEQTDNIAHGICQTSEGPDRSIAVHQTVRWMNRYLKGDRGVDTGPGFEWISQEGVDRGAAGYPLPAGPPLTVSGSGTLTLVAGDTSGTQITAGGAGNAVNVPVPPVARPTQVVGEPSLTLDYSGTAAQADARVYAQLVNASTLQVAGPVVTPVPLTLDGHSHTVTLPLEAVALDLSPASSYMLQITDGTSVYFPARQPGLVQLSRIALSLPTVAASTAAGDEVQPTSSGPGARRPALRLTTRPRSARTGCRRFRFTVRSGGHRVRGARVTFHGHHRRTGRQGVARMRACVSRPRILRARAAKRGYRPASARVRIARARRAPRFTG